MKQLLTILFIFFFAYSFGQTPYFFQRSSGVNTLQDVRLAAKDNFYVAYNATDTSLNGGVDTLGAMLHVRFGALQGLWYRDSITGGGHKWQRVTPTSENYWQLSGSNLYPVSNSYNVGIGASPSYQFDVQNSGTGRFYFDGNVFGLYDNTSRYNIIIGSAGVGGSASSGTKNIYQGFGAGANATTSNNVALSSTSLFSNTYGGGNVAIGSSALRWLDSSNNVGIGYNAGVAMFSNNNVSIGAESNVGVPTDSSTITKTDVQVGTKTITGTSTGTFISSTSLTVGVQYVFLLHFTGTPALPFSAELTVVRGTVTDANTITFSYSSNFTAISDNDFVMSVYGKYSNSIAIGYNAIVDASNKIVMGNSSTTLFKSNQFVVDVSDVPATGEVLTWNGTAAIWDTIVGGGGGAYSFLTPLSELAGVVSIQNASADGSTKGAASFTAVDFNASSGNISIDYTNGQAASTTLKGFLTNTDWNTFNNKVSTGLITASGLTISTATLAGRYSAGTGAIQEITLGSGLSLSGSGVLTASGSGGITTLNTLTAATQFFAIGSSGTSPSWSVSGGNTHSLNLPTTSATNTGLVTPTLYNSWTAKQDAITGAATTITTSNLTSNRALISSATGKVDVSPTTNTELGYVSGVTSAIQTQLNNKAPLVSKTFQALGLSGSDISWVYTSGYNASYTITADRDILVSGDADGDYGTLIITQNATGGWDLTVPNTDFLQDGINVVGQPFTIDLPDAANSVAIVSWVNHSGVRYWTFGYYHQ